METFREALIGRLKQLGGVVVAFSGGTDSALVLALAREALGERAVAATGVSASFPAAELAHAKRFAEGLQVRHELIETRELDDPSYAENPTDRCYFCKRELYARCLALAQSLGLPQVVDGFNADDANEHRPGRRAAVERAIVSPLAEAGLRKADVRELARQLGLSVWDKPANPCLSSRLPFGMPVTVERLAQVAAAEESLRRLGFRTFRVRHHGEVARLEVAQLELDRFWQPDLRAQVDAALKKAGYRFVALDLLPFRSGRLSEGLVQLNSPLY